MLKWILYGALIQCLLSALAYGLELVEPSAGHQLLTGIIWSFLILASAALQRAAPEDAKGDA